MMFRPALAVLLGLVVVAATTATSAADRPQWGERLSRNMVSDEKGLPDSFDPGKPGPGSEEIDPATTRNVRWAVRLGSQTNASPVVAGGKVYIGMNQEKPHDSRFDSARAVLLCLAEADGKTLWQLAVPKLIRPKWGDWFTVGVSSTPTVEGDRVYLVTNRCEVVCLDAAGMANGNDGPYTDEARHMADEGKPPIQPGPGDADIVWLYDMIGELGVQPHNASNCSILVVGNYLYVCTSNGVEWTHKNVMAPDAPSLIVLDKKTGKLVAKDDLKIGPDLYHCQWCSPSWGEVAGKPLVFWGGGNGWMYAFEPVGAPSLAPRTGGGAPAMPAPPVPPVYSPGAKDGAPATLKVDSPGAKSGAPAALKVAWRFNCDPDGRFAPGRASTAPADPNGPSVCIAMPVPYKDRVYVASGGDCWHGKKAGRLACIDASKTGDITATGKVWQYDTGRCIATVSIADGLVYVAGHDGRVHCLDAETGQAFWVHEAKGEACGSTLVADGKVYLGTGKGDLWVLAAGKEKKVISQVRVGAPIFATPVAANGVLYVASHRYLYAVAGEAAPKKPAEIGKP